MNEENPPGPSYQAEASASPVEREINQEEELLENLLCLPTGWIPTLCEVDQFWISDALFRWSESHQPELNPTIIDEFWHYPPQPSFWFSRGSYVVPALEQYFGHPLFLWMPLTQLNTRLICPWCKNTKLTHAGLHQELKQVVGYNGFYYLASESLFCVNCNQSFIAWSNGIVSQLDIDHRFHFPCLLTHTLGCDKQVLRLMRQKGFENLKWVENLLQEQYKEEWVKKQLQFTSAFRSSTEAVSIDEVSPVLIGEIPTMLPFPKHNWFMQVYVQDLLTRMDEIKASITSLFGQVLTIDSSKRVVRNLSRQKQLKEAWLTNVWNEHGQIIMSVLTENEGCDLTKMADGLVQRYKEAGEKPPKVLYVDRGCCGDSNVKKLFGAWPKMKVRLDAGHFKRAFSNNLHMGFMSALSQCIFDYDEEDMQHLREAKRAELEDNGIVPSESEVTRHVKKAEMKQHCRKKVRDAGTIEQMIERLIKMYEGRMSAPHLDSEKIKTVWEEQRRHVLCLQNPPGLSLYTKTGRVKKGGRVLPVYQCARGATFMRNLNQHMDKFNPGLLASPSVFQALLVDGLSRWNEDRTKTKKSTHSLPSHSSALVDSVNQLAQELWGKKLLDCPAQPKYTGELIGIEYLYNEANLEMEDYETTASSLEPWEIDGPFPDCVKNECSPGTEEVKEEACMSSCSEKHAADMSRVKCEDLVPSTGLPVPLSLTVKMKEEPFLPPCKEEDIQNPILPPNTADMTLVKCDEDLAPSTGLPVPFPLKLETPSPLSPTMNVKEKTFLLPCKDEDIQNPILPAHITVNQTQVTSEDLAPSTGHSRPVPPQFEPPSPLFIATSLPITTQPLLPTPIKRTTPQPVLFAPMTLSTLRPILPAPTVQPVIQFMVVTPCSLPPVAPVAPVPAPNPVNIPSSAQCHQKKKLQEETQGKKKRKYVRKTDKTICHQCEKERDPATHYHYYGNWYCQDTARVPLAEWRKTQRERRQGRCLKRPLP